MKLLLSLATALLLSGSAFATAKENASKTLNLDVFPRGVTAQLDQYYSFNFAPTSVTFSRYADLNLNNRGPGNLIVHEIAMAGTDFNAYFNCPRVLPPNTFCTIRVRFNPWFEGFKTGRLYIITHEGRIMVDLSGWATR